MTPLEMLVNCMPEHRENWRHRHCRETAAPPVTLCDRVPFVDAEWNKTKTKAQNPQK